MGQAQEDPHRKDSKEKREGVSLVVMDYMYMKSKEGTGREVEAEESSEEEEDGESDAESKKFGLPTLVMRDVDRGVTFATTVPRKGKDPFGVRRASRDITKVLGLKRLILKCDQEPAILDLKEAIRLESGIEIIDEESMVGDSASNGAAENAVKRVQGKVRSIKSGLERRLKQKLPEDRPILAWLIRHAGACITRYEVGADGMTGHKR